ncbi:MAG TPA: hypothetical protein VMP68_00675 [Candidatus Eisenbacteria bacterium]|nr:hypothetical protein [Candidatus Eisenbacteria bacterium]
MKRKTAFLAASISLALLFTIGLHAQETRPDSRVPEDAFSTRQLIAWSGLQKPQPAPQPLPPKDTPVPQPDQPQDQQSSPPADPHSQETPTQSFTGKIVNDSGKYALKVGTEVYGLDQQDGLQKYENQSVKVIGRMGANSRMIHILKIDLLS